MGQAIKLGIALFTREAVAGFSRVLGYMFAVDLLRRGGGFARHLNSPSKGRAAQTDKGRGELRIRREITGVTKCHGG
jgi:hypothetical protein